MYLWTVYDEYSTTHWRCPSGNSCEGVNRVIVSLLLRRRTFPRSRLIGQPCIPWRREFLRRETLWRKNHNVRYALAPSASLTKYDYATHLTVPCTQHSNGGSQGSFSVETIPRDHVWTFIHVDAQIDTELDRPAQRRELQPTVSWQRVAHKSVRIVRHASHAFHAILFFFERQRRPIYPVSVRLIYLAFEHLRDDLVWTGDGAHLWVLRWCLVTGVHSLRQQSYRRVVAGMGANRIKLKRTYSVKFICLVFYADNVWDIGQWLGRHSAGG